MNNINSPVLILNNSWLPIRVRTVKEAICLVFREKACIVDPGDYSTYTWGEWITLDCFIADRYIQAVHDRVKLPEIIVLKHYNQIPTYNLRLTKKNLFIRDKFTCQYTGKNISHKEADIDHVIPRSKGGRTVWSNLVVCDKTVNRKKADRTPEEAGLALRKQPRKPSALSLLIDPRMEQPESWKKFLIHG